MKKVYSNVILSLILVVTSAAIYTLQLIQFNSPRDTVFYFLQDMAFLPLQVAIVTIVLGRILKSREKRERLKKINMAISAFFSEVGTSIIIKIVKFNIMLENLQSDLDINGKWTKRDFQRAIRLIKNYDFSIDYQVCSLQELKILLLEKRDFLLKMLENPNLLEHDTFTDMLWSVFHLTDELIARDSMIDLPETDLNHLAVDAQRAFSTLIVQWINHMEHLKSDYPYLFSLEVRRNPFNNKNSVVIRQ
ncbi:MAG: hypothetical protein N2Z65_02650 [Clostridiales bacterium]|nr:hypothetical protein [Clostridiales bacterium]